MNKGLELEQKKRRTSADGDAEFTRKVDGADDADDLFEITVVDGRGRAGRARTDEVRTFFLPTEAEILVMLAIWSDRKETKSKGLRNRGRSRGQSGEEEKEKEEQKSASRRSRQRDVQNFFEASLSRLLSTWDPGP